MTPNFWVVSYGHLEALRKEVRCHAQSLVLHTNSKAEQQLGIGEISDLEKEEEETGDLRRYTKFVSQYKQRFHFSFRFL